MLHACLQVSILAAAAQSELDIWLVGCFSLIGFSWSRVKASFVSKPATATCNGGFCS